MHFLFYFFDLLLEIIHVAVFQKFFLVIFNFASMLFFAADYNFFSCVFVSLPLALAILYKTVALL